MKTFRIIALAVTATILLVVDAYAGRWLSRDPITEGAGFVQREPTAEMKFLASREPPQRNDLNLYGFVQNNPIILVDRLGLDIIGPPWPLPPDPLPDPRFVSNNAYCRYCHYGRVYLLSYEIVHVNVPDPRDFSGFIRCAQPIWNEWQRACRNFNVYRMRHELGPELQRCHDLHW